MTRYLQRVQPPVFLKIWGLVLAPCFYLKICLHICVCIRLAQLHIKKNPPILFYQRYCQGEKMQIMELESAAGTHNKVFYQSANEVASWKIYGKRV